MVNIEELKNKIGDLEKELSASKQIIDALRDEKAHLKATVNLYETRYPKLKKNLEEKGEEGDVTDG